MAAVKKGEGSLPGLNSPDHDVEQNHGSNNAAFNVVMNGEGKDHRYDENLVLVSGGYGSSGPGRCAYKTQAVRDLSQENRPHG